MQDATDRAVQQSPLRVAVPLPEIRREERESLVKGDGLRGDGGDGSAGGRAGGDYATNGEESNYLSMCPPTPKVQRGSC